MLLLLVIDIIDINISNQLLRNNHINLSINECVCSLLFVWVIEVSLHFNAVILYTTLLYSVVEQCFYYYYVWMLKQVTISILNIVDPSITWRRGQVIRVIVITKIKLIKLNPPGDEADEANDDVAEGDWKM